VSSLKHDEVVDLLKVKTTRVNIVAVRSATDHQLILSDSLTSSCVTSPATVVANAIDNCQCDAAVSDRAGGEMDDVCDKLLSIRRMVHVLDCNVKRTKARGHISATSSSSIVLPSVQTSQDRQATRKTASSTGSVALPASAAGDDEQHLVNSTRSSSTLQLSCGLCPISPNPNSRKPVSFTYFPKEEMPMTSN